MNHLQSRGVRVERSLYPAGLAVLLIAATTVACNLTSRWRVKKELPVRRCFAQSNGTTANRSNTATNNTPAADNTVEQLPTQQQTENVITSEDGGFTIKLPRGFPPPDPPDPIKRGYEYAGISYYSYLSGCRCRFNYTELTAIASAGQPDEQVLAGRRELVSKEFVNNAYQPVTIYKTEESRVQNQRTLSVYVSGTGVDERPEYRRFKFIVGKGRVYQIEFASEDKTELDHPEVNAFFNSLQFIGDLDGQAISKPEAEYPPMARTMRTQGTVVVEVIVSTDGEVIDARVVSGPKALQAAAKAAALKARFAPRKSEIKGTLTYRFTIP